MCIYCKIEKGLNYLHHFYYRKVNESFYNAHIALNEPQGHVYYQVFKNTLDLKGFMY